MERKREYNLLPHHIKNMVSLHYKDTPAVADEQFERKGMQVHERITEFQELLKADPQTEIRVTCSRTDDFICNGNKESENCNGLKDDKPCLKYPDIKEFWSEILAEEMGLEVDRIYTFEELLQINGPEGRFFINEDKEGNSTAS